MEYDTVRRLCATLAFIAASAVFMPVHGQEPETREEEIAAAQAEKGRDLHPYVPSAGEQLMGKAQEVLSASENNWHPFFESAYPEGGFAFGSGFARHVSPYNKIDVRGSYTIKSYK